MMNVLDALRYRLARPGEDLEGEPLDPVTLEMIGRRPLPPGLPLVVQDQIRNQPSYPEGGRYPVREIPGEQNLPDDDPRNREYRLGELLDFNQYMRRNSQQAWPEGTLATPLQPGESPFGSPLNQLMGRGWRPPSFGQY